MSAFIVSKEHIDAMLTPLQSYSSDDELSEMGNTLWQENYKSVNYRYRENEFAPEYRFVSNMQSNVQVLKLCNCYDYQSCETNTYKDSEAYKIVNSIRKIVSSDLDGYDEAEWAL